MSQVCESLINDYLAGALNIQDLEQGLASIFDAIPQGHVQAQTYLQSLYTSDRIDSEGFTQISQVISKVNIQATLKTDQNSDISYFGDDRTMHLTDLDDDADEDDGNDKTVIVSVGGNDADNFEPSEPSIDPRNTSPTDPKINPAIACPWPSNSPVLGFVPVIGGISRGEGK